MRSYVISHLLCDFTFAYVIWHLLCDIHIKTDSKYDKYKEIWLKFLSVVVIEVADYWQQEQRSNLDLDLTDETILRRVGLYGTLAPLTCSIQVDQCFPRTFQNFNHIFISHTYRCWIKYNLFCNKNI